MTVKPLEGQTALVTGASRGIGAAIAVQLAGAGAHVILTARTAAGLESVEDSIYSNGGTATIAPMNLLETDSISRLALALSERWGTLDMLILNAAMLGMLSPVPSIDAKEFAQMMMLNVTAQQALIASFDPMLRASKRGRVIGVTSSVATSPRAYWGAYGASKAAFEALLKTYGEERRRLGSVAVAIIDPGATRTAMRAHAFPGEDPETVKSPDIVGARIADLASVGFENGHYECMD